MIQLRFGFILLFSSYMSASVQAEVRRYVVEIQIAAPERKGEYVPTLLKMILTASKAPDEVIEIALSDHMYSQARWIAEVRKQDNNNVLWTVTTKEREQLLRPIRVPIYKGLLGKRLLVIRKQDEEKFAKIKNKNDLAMFVAGQGTHWPDNDILATNGLVVMLGIEPESLYKMLQANRFDYFPRGVVELFSEAKFINGTDLVIDKNIFLSYKNPLYFFVNNKNTELAERLEKGWEIILKNGEFDTFFFNDPHVKSALEELKKYNRRIIHLDNPALPDETPVDPKYWIEP